MVCYLTIDYHPGRAAALRKQTLRMNQDLHTICQTLKNGGVVACPTDTVYGLLADATNEKAVKKIREIKQRDAKKGMPIFVYSLKEAKAIADINEEQGRILQSLWPGKLTAILAVKKGVGIAPSALTDNNTIALRIPNHTLVREILKQYKKPLTGTSANLSGKESCRAAACVKEQFELKTSQPDMIIEGEELVYSEPSTIVDLTKKPYKMLRKGAEYKKIEQLL